MSVRLPLTLGRDSKQARAPMQSIERLLNAYLEIAPEGKEPTPIYGTPGLTLRISGLDGAIRGVCDMGGVPYVVAGTKLYSFDTAWNPTDRGTIPGTDLVQMASDGANVVTVAGGEIYVWNGTTLAAVTDPDAPSASSVAWVDSYFIFGETDTQQWFISALADPTAYDALDFASAEWKPDLLRTPIILRRTVYLAGTKTIEAQQNVGAADFPFAPADDVLIDVGIAGRDAWAASNDALFWVASDDTVRRLDGITATVISKARQTRLIKGWADKTATVASAHVIDNHLFIVFRNPDGCIVYDQSTERWHDRASYGQASWRVRHYFEAYGRQLFCSATEGKIYELDTEAYDEDGDVLEFEVVTPWAYIANREFSIDELEVAAQTGVGTATLDPVMTSERTRDGETWSARKEQRLGKQGVRKPFLRYGPQGSARQMAFRFRITDRVKRAILGCYADVDAEAA